MEASYSPYIRLSSKSFGFISPYASAVDLFEERSGDGVKAFRRIGLHSGLPFQVALELN